MVEREVGEVVEEGPGYTCGKHSVGDRGQRFEVRYQDAEGGEHVCGWTEDPSNLVAAIDAHPSFHSPQVLDRDPWKRRNQRRARWKWSSVPNLAMAAALVFLTLASFHALADRDIAAIAAALQGIAWLGVRHSYVGLSRGEENAETPKHGNGGRAT